LKQSSKNTLIKKILAKTLAKIELLWSMLHTTKEFLNNHLDFYMILFRTDRKGVLGLQKHPFPSL